MALGISDAVSLSGRVLELVKAGATLELQERIVELREAVLNAKDEILSLREELSTLKRAATEREQLEFNGIVYWRELPDGENEGPFCQRCYDADSKLMRLHKCGADIAYEWACTGCKMLIGAREPDRQPMYRA